MIEKILKAIGVLLLAALILIGPAMLAAMVVLSPLSSIRLYIVLVSLILIAVFVYNIIWIITKRGDQIG